MKLLGEIHIEAPRPTVWQALNDPLVLARCIPGCEGMEAVSDTEFTAQVAVKVGPVRARFSGRVLLSDIIPEQSYTLQFEGSGGAAGMAKGQSSVSLADAQSGTLLTYSVQASIGGKLGQVGGRMIDAAAKQMANQFFTAFQNELAPKEAGAPVVLNEGSEATSLPNQLQTSALESASSTPTKPTQTPDTERLRITWFALGALSTALGVWLGSVLFR